MVVIGVWVGCELDFKTPSFCTEVDDQIDLILIARAEMIQVGKKGFNAKC